MPETDRTFSRRAGLRNARRADDSVTGARVCECRRRSSSGNRGRRGSGAVRSFETRFQTWTHQQYRPYARLRIARDSRTLEPRAVFRGDGFLERTWRVQAAAIDLRELAAIAGRRT